MVPLAAGGSRRAIALILPSLHSTETLRLFVALSIPDEVKNRIETVQSELRWLLPQKTARWTHREQFHLTLRFLGNVAVNRLDELVAAATTACQSSDCLHLTAGRLGFFPEPRFPQVLWVGVKEEQDQLVSLWAAIELALRPFTEEPAEKDFTGHVTLARLNRLRRPEVDQLTRAAAKYSDVVLGNWTSHSLEVMRSELLPQGSRHIVIAELPLGKASVP